MTWVWLMICLPEYPSISWQKYSEFNRLNIAPLRNCPSTKPLKRTNDETAAFFAPNISELYPSKAMNSGIWIIATADNQAKIILMSFCSTYSSMLLLNANKMRDIVILQGKM